MSLEVHIKTLAAAASIITRAAQELIDEADPNPLETVAELHRALGRVETVIEHLTDQNEKCDFEPKLKVTPSKAGLVRVIGEDLTVGNIKKMLNGMDDDSLIFPTWYGPPREADPSVSIAGFERRDTPVGRDPRTGLMVLVELVPLNEDEDDDDEKDNDEDGEDAAEAATPDNHPSDPLL